MDLRSASASFRRPRRPHRCNLESAGKHKGFLCASNNYCPHIPHRQTMAIQLVRLCDKGVSTRLWVSSIPLLAVPLGLQGGNPDYFQCLVGATFNWLWVDILGQRGKWVGQVGQVGQVQVGQASGASEGHPKSPPPTPARPNQKSASNRAAQSDADLWKEGRGEAGTCPT